MKTLSLSEIAPLLAVAPVADKPSAQRAAHDTADDGDAFAALLDSPVSGVAQQTSGKAGPVAFGATAPLDTAPPAQGQETAPNALSASSAAQRFSFILSGLNGGGTLASPTASLADTAPVAHPHTLPLAPSGTDGETIAMKSAVAEIPGAISSLFAPETMPPANPAPPDARADSSADSGGDASARSTGALPASAADVSGESGLTNAVAVAPPLAPMPHAAQVHTDAKDKGLPSSAAQPAPVSPAVGPDVRWSVNLAATGPAQVGLEPAQPNSAAQPWPSSTPLAGEAGGRHALEPITSSGGDQADPLLARSAAAFAPAHRMAGRDTLPATPAQGTPVQTGKEAGGLAAASNTPSATPEPAKAATVAENPAAPATQSNRANAAAGSVTVAMARGDTAVRRAAPHQFADPAPQPAAATAAAAPASQPPQAAPLSPVMRNFAAAEAAAAGPEVDAQAAIRSAGPPSVDGATPRDARAETALGAGAVAANPSTPASLGATDADTALARQNGTNVTAPNAREETPVLPLSRSPRAEVPPAEPPQATPLVTRAAARSMAEAQIEAAFASQPANRPGATAISASVAAVAARQAGISTAPVSAGAAAATHPAAIASGAVIAPPEVPAPSTGHDGRSTPTPAAGAEGRSAEPRETAILTRHAAEGPISLPAASAATPADGLAAAFDPLAALSISATDRPLSSLPAQGPHALGSAAPGQSAASAPGLAQQLALAMPDTVDRPIEITLTPEELGKVRMTLHSTEGSISVSVQAERPETLDLMRRNIDSLARDFRDMGYSQISFDFSDRPSGQQMPQEPLPQPETAEQDPPARFLHTSIAVQPGLSDLSGGLDLRM